MIAITHDDQLKAVVDTEDQAFVWLLRHQGQSVSYATTHGGWKIEQVEDSAKVALAGVEVTITRSAGSDGAMVVFIDTSFEPYKSPGLRVLINDDDTYIGVPYESKPEEEA